MQSAKSFRHGLPYILLSGLLLTACAIRQPANTPTTDFVNKTVLSNTTTNLGGIQLVNPDCTTRGFPTLRLVEPPAHGTVYLVQREDYPTFPITNPRNVCNKQKLPGTFIDYTSQPGFVGVDNFAVDYFVDGGSSKQERITVTVK